MGRVAKKRLPLPPVPTEREERRMVVRFRDQWRSKYPELRYLIAIHNEQRFVRSQARSFFAYWQGMTEQGYQAGIPDYVLPVARWGYFGLWIELKRLRGSQVTPEQRAWCQALANLGHAVVVAKGASVVCETLLWYVQGERTRPWPVRMVDMATLPGKLIGREEWERGVE